MDYGCKGVLVWAVWMLRTGTVTRANYKPFTGCQHIRFRIDTFWLCSKLMSSLNGI